ELGRNLTIVNRWTAGDARLTRDYAAEVTALKPDLIFVQSNEILARVLEETRAIPIVVAVFSDPVGSGFVSSLARPGGNVTGFSNLDPPMGGKWLQQLQEIAPSVRRAAFVLNPDISANVAFLRSAESVSTSVGIEVGAIAARTRSELEAGIAEFASRPAGGLI